MKKRLKGFQYQVKVNKEEEAFLQTCVSASNFIYNLACRTQAFITAHYYIRRKSVYAGKVINAKGETFYWSAPTPSFYDFGGELKEIRASKEWQEMGFENVSQVVLEMSLKNFFGESNTGFKGFQNNVVKNKPVCKPKEGKTLRFRKKFGFPKTKDGSVRTFQIRRPKVDLENWTIRVPNLGLVRLCKQENYKLEGTPKIATFKQKVNGRWQVSIVVEQQVEEVKQKEIKKETAIGIDVGLSHYIIDSKGNKEENPRFLVKSLPQLRREQRKLDRKYQKNVKTENQSKGWHKQKKIVARLQEKIANQRKTYQHQLTSKIVKENDTICVETLNVKGMIKNKKLSKHISDAAWGGFIEKLKYKSDWHGKNLIKIDKWFPSSKTCSNCNHKLEEMKLSVRNWTCPSCSEKHDRDINASINIKKEGLRISLETKKIT